MPYRDSQDNRDTITVGIEIANSGTLIRASAQDATYTRHASARIAQPATPDQVVPRISQLVEQTCQSLSDERGFRAPVAIGIAVWGAVDAARRSVISLRHSHVWREVRLAELLSTAWNCPVRIESAVGAAALAEARLASEQGPVPMLYLLPERSLSAVLISDGTIDGTTGGDPSRFGHWPVPGNARRCSCGAVGHLETVASAQAIVRNMIGLASADDISYEAMMRVSNGRAETMTAAQVAELARSSDQVASRIMEEAIQALAPILAGVVEWHDVPVIIVGGILASADETFLRPLREELARHIGRAQSAPQVRSARSTGNAVLRGAMIVSEQARGLRHAS